MKPMSAYRLTALTCVWFAFFSLLPAMKVWSLAPVLVLAAVLIASFAAVQLKHPAARLGVALLPLLTLLYAWQSGLLMTIVCAAPILLIAIALAADRVAIAYWRLKREFIWLAAASILLLLISFNPILFSAQSCVFIGGFLIFGIISLRAGRAGSYRSFRWQAGNAGLFLMAVAAAAGVGTILMIGFDKLIEWLKQFDVKQKVIREVTTPQPITGEAIRINPTQNPMTSSVPRETAAPQSDVHVVINTKKLDFWWIAAGIMLVLAIALLIVLLLTRTKDKKDPQELLEPEPEENRNPKAKRQRRSRRKQTNSDRVREIYRDYLRYLRVQGIMIRNTATTSDISENAASLQKDDTTLRALYRKARYGRADDPITDEQVQEAKECLERLTAKQAKQTGVTLQEQ